MTLKGLCGIEGARLDNPLRKIDVVFSADYGYIPHLATAVTSLLETNKERVADIWVITDAGTTLRFQQLVEDVRHRYGLALRILPIGASSFAGLYVSGHVSWAAYSRFLIGDLLPERVSWALYLDSDLLVVSSISTILEATARQPNSPSPIVFAVPRDSGEHLEQLGFGGSRYFNSGVLLIDLKLWREEGLGHKLFEKGKEVFGRIHLWDQDVLNLVLEGRWSELPGEFNETQVKAKSDSHCIVHFVGGTKPWMVGGQHPYRADYLRYRSMTPFWPFFPKGLGKFLRKLLLPRPLQRPVRTLRKLGRKALRKLRGFQANS